MTENTISNCQEWLDGLKLDDIPKHKGWQRSLMDITGVTHHENMWSDIYKFFFDENEEHGLKDLFIRSLEQVAHIDNRFLLDFNVRREYVIDGNERIDLLLYDKSQKNAIIIENKVYHTMNNDLANYYNSIKKEGYKEILVLVIGLKNYRNTTLKSNDKYCSITHLDLLETVLINLPKYLTEANPHYLYLLEEFYKNVKNHTNMIDPKELAFFCEKGNQEKIVKIHDIYNSIKNYIVKVMECGKDSPLKNHIESLNLTPKPERNYVKYLFNDKRAQKNMMLTVFYRDTILRPEKGIASHIHVVLEIQGSIKQKIEENKELFMHFLKSYQDIMPNDNKHNGWWHFASMIIPLHDLESDLPKLAEIVSSKINEDCSLLKLGYAILDETQK